MTGFNPITKMDYPDPSVIRVEDTFYMVSTTMHFFPGAAILRSYDLVNWEVASYVYNTLDDTVGEHLDREHVNYGGGMWAPSFRYHDGRYYVTFNSHTGDTKTYIYSAADINGPWERLVLEDVFYDCSLFFDDDGKKYMVYGNRTIWLTELKDDLSGIKPGGYSRILFEDEKGVMLGFEGSHIEKVNGFYYIFNIRWAMGDIRTQWCHRSKTLDGEFEGKIIFHDDTGRQGAGIAQGSIIDSEDGKWYCILFQDSGAVGRIPVLLPVTWENDWPVPGVNGKLPETFEVPDAKGRTTEPLYTSEFWRKSADESVQSMFMKQWQWNHQPKPDAWDRQGKGLKLTSGKLSINVTHTYNCLTQRMLYPGCSAQVTVDVSNLKDGDVAGICGLQSCYGFIGVLRQAGNNYLVVVRRTPDKLVHLKKTGDSMPGEIVEQIVMKGDRVTLMIKADFRDFKDQMEFFYKKNGEMVRLGEPQHMEYRLDHFTGYRFGLFIYSTRVVGGSVLFTNFKYIAEE